MDELMIVGEFDWHRSIYEYVMDMVVFTIPSNMKTSHVADELRRLVQPPHLCLYDGLLGVQIDANELCQRIASCSSDDRKRHAQLFVPLRLEHWLVRHLVTVHLLLSEMRVVYYDPNGVSYDNETRVIVGLDVLSRCYYNRYQVGTNIRRDFNNKDCCHPFRVDDLIFNIYVSQSQRPNSGYIMQPASLHEKSVHTRRSQLDSQVEQASATRPDFWTNLRTTGLGNVMRTF
jgi:hypothetical protein